MLSLSAPCGAARQSACAAVQSPHGARRNGVERPRSKWNAAETWCARSGSSPFQPKRPGSMSCSPYWPMTTAPEMPSPSRSSGSACSASQVSGTRSSRPVPCRSGARRGEIQARSVSWSGPSIRMRGRRSSTAVPSLSVSVWISNVRCSLLSGLRPGTAKVCTWLPSIGCGTSAPSFTAPTRRVSPAEAGRSPSCNETLARPPPWWQDEQARALNSGPSPSAALVEDGAETHSRSNRALPSTVSIESSAACAAPANASSAPAAATKALRDSDIAHHPGFLMLDNVTVHHPFSGVVRCERDLNPFLGRDQDGVGEMRDDLLLAGSEHAEGMAVQVDRVRVRGAVEQLEHVGAAALQLRQRRRLQLVVLTRPGLAVDGPEGALR